MVGLFLPRTDRSMALSIISIPTCETESWLLNRHYAKRLCPISYAFMKTIKEYLSEIGAKGGKKSRRKLTKEEASRIAKLRWTAVREFREGMGR